MSRRPATVRALAKESGLDLDEALVTLWDAGIDDVDDIDSVVPASKLSTARRVFGLLDPKRMQTVSFWTQEWGLTQDELREKLAAEYNITLSPNARVLPKGALRRLRQQLPPTAQVAIEPSAPEMEVPPPLIWNPPGHRRSIDALSVDEVLAIHEALVDDFAAGGDPIEPAGVRDPHLLESALSRPATSLGGVLKYDTVESHAAALMHSLVHNHPFHNGNKRTALVSMLVVLDRNHLLLTCSEKDLFRYVLRVAQHRLMPKHFSDRADREVLLISEWLCQNCRVIRKGERVLKFQELRRILNAFDCVVSQALPGNKIKIERTIERKNVLGLRRLKTLRVTTGRRNEGSEVDQGMLAYIRRELHLDEQHGFDSDYFYGNDPRAPDEFIAQYRGILRRLARL